MSTELLPIAPVDDPDHGPEFVGAYSEPVLETCWKLLGETEADVHTCGKEATHTIVYRARGSLEEIAVCDACGRPEDVDGA